MKKQRYVWIVEMLLTDRWTPTVGAALDREQASRVLAHWRSTNPSDKFRIAKYIVKNESPNTSLRKGKAMPDRLEVLLVRDATEAKTRSRAITLSGGTDDKRNEAAVVGSGSETFVWIGERGGHCYGVLQHDEMKLLIEHYNDARITEG